MRTRKSVHDILGRIMETGGMSSEMEADIGTIRDEFAERDRLLGEAYEPWDEELDEVELTIKESPAARSDREYRELEGKYNDLVARYKSSFFSGGETHEYDDVTDVAEGVSGKEENAEEVLRVAELFKEVD